MDIAPVSDQLLRIFPLKTLFGRLLLLGLVSVLSACGLDVAIDSHLPDNSRVIYLDPGETIEFEVSGPTYSLYSESLFQVGVQAQWAVYEYQPDDYLAGPVLNILPRNRAGTRIHSETDSAILNPFRYQFTAPEGKPPQYYLISYSVFSRKIGGTWNYAESSRAWLVYVGDKAQVPPVWEGDFLVSNTEDLAKLRDYSSINGTLSVMPFNSLEDDSDGSIWDGLREDNLVMVTNQVEDRNITFSLRLGSRPQDGLVTTLDDLSGIGYIAENLYIFSNEQLDSFDGLQQIQRIDGHLMVFRNALISDFGGLSNLNSLGGDFYLQSNPNLNSIEALSNIDAFGGAAVIAWNPELLSLSGLENITTVEGRFELTGFNGADPFTAMSNLTAVNGEFSLRDNAGVRSLAGLENLAVIGDTLTVKNNPELQSLEGLQGLQMVDGLSVIGNNKLFHLTGLENLSSLAGDLRIRDSYLTSLAALSGIETVNGGVHVDSNRSLENLMGLENMTGIGGTLSLQSNRELSSIESLYQLQRVGSFFVLNNRYLCDDQAQALLDIIQSREGVDPAGTISIGNPCRSE